MGGEAEPDAAPFAAHPSFPDRRRGCSSDEQGGGSIWRSNKKENSKMDGQLLAPQA